jgi:hypothetical protein
LTELANLSQSFRPALVNAVSQLAPPAEDKRILFKTAVYCDVIKTGRDLSFVKEAHSKIDQKIARRRAQIEQIEADTRRMEEDIAEMKRKLYEESDLFGRFRSLKARIAGINDQFEAMFCPESQQLPRDVQQLIDERAENEKLLECKRAECDVMQQLTRRVRFYEQCLNEGK